MTGNRLKILRKHLNLSQKKFGDRLKVSQSLINALENGSRVVTERFVDDVCREYGVNREWLLYNEEPMLADPLEGISVDDEVKELTNALMGLDKSERDAILTMIKAFSKKD